MSSRHLLNRAFPHRAMFRGPALRSILWGVAATLLFGMILLDAGLLLDFLVRREPLRLTGDQVARLEESTGAELVRQELVPTRRYTLSNRGLLPTVWSVRDTAPGRPLARLYSAIPMLRSDSGALAALILFGAVVGILHSIARLRARSLSTLAASGAASRIRSVLRHQALRLGPSDLEDGQSDQAFSLFAQQIERLRGSIDERIQAAGRLPLELFLLVALAFAIHWVLALQCLIPLAGCWILLRRSQARRVANRRLAEDRAGPELRRLGEGLHKARLVRGFAMDEFERTQFDKHLKRFEDHYTAARRSELRSIWGTRVIVVVTVAVLSYLIASKMVLDPGHVDHLPVSAGLLFVLTMVSTYGPLQRFARWRTIQAEAGLAADKVYRYIDRIPEVGQAVGAKFLQPLSKSLRFESVTYLTHGRRKLLDGLDCTIPAGTVTAIVSSNPLEARAMAYLLPRFIEPQSGRILFDGEDIAWATLESLRAETIFVGGTEPFLTGSVAENISCGNERFSLQEVIESAKQTHANNFVLKLAEGYETILGEHGETLDAGQAFRLGLARAALRKPALLLIEEPPPPLDEDTKSMLDDAYSRLVKDRTVIFLPSRLSTVRRADQIIVLDRGRVVATGNHAGLLKESDVYRHWEYVNFNEFRRRDVAETQ